MSKIVWYFIVIIFKNLLVIFDTHFESITFMKRIAWYLGIPRIFEVFQTIQIIFDTCGLHRLDFSFPVFLPCFMDFPYIFTLPFTLFQSFSKLVYFTWLIAYVKDFHEFLGPDVERISREYIEDFEFSILCGEN